MILLLSAGQLSAQVQKNIPLKVAENAHLSDSLHQRAADSLRRHRTTVPQKDITDELHFLFKKKRSDTVKEVRKLTFSVLPAVGYTLTTRTAGTITSNAAFRTDTNIAKTKISTITASAAYTQNKQFSVPLETNIWAKGNKYNFVGDIHFMKYPQSTFGLGSNSWIGNVDLMQYNYIRFYEIIYRQITPNFFAGAGYIIDWRYHITAENTQEPIPDDYELYGPQSTSVSTGFTLNALYDTRDNSINPYKGFYANGAYRNSLTFMGSNRNWQSLIIDIRKYFNFPRDSRNILAVWNYDWLVLNGNLPTSICPPPIGTPIPVPAEDISRAGSAATKWWTSNPNTASRFSPTDSSGSSLPQRRVISGLNSHRLQAFQPGWGAGLRVKLNTTSRTNLDIDYGFGDKVPTASSSISANCSDPLTHSASSPKTALTFQ